MAHNLYGIAYQFYRDRFHLERFAGRDMMVRFLDRSLRAEVGDEPGFLSRLILLWNRRRKPPANIPATVSLLRLLQSETRKLLKADLELSSPGLDPHATVADQDGRWFEFVRQLSDRVTLHFGEHIVDHLSGANVFNIFHTIGAAGGLYALLAPYFVAFSLFSGDREFSRGIHRRFVRPTDPSGEPAGDTRIAHFTDTFHEVNGVAYTLQQHARIACRNRKRLAVVTCSRDGATAPGVKNFAPLGVYELPEYPEQKLAFPSLLDMLQYCYEEDFTQIHTSTPGPVGLAALAIARILKLPISGTYHTEIPQYAGILTGDRVIADITWRYVLWYYDQMDLIYTPSVTTKQELVSKGIAADKVRVYPRGVDTGLFNPARRNGYFSREHGIAGGLKLLYVGRISREKNLDLLAQAFRSLAAEGGGVHLVVVGDGPYLAQMKAEMRGLPCIFTGYLKGDILSTVYASSDLFVFPSTTDTFGNVVLEAQASGLPVIVTDQGGPAENIRPGETGVVVKGGDAGELLRAMRSLVSRPERIRRMGAAARAYMEERSFDAAFLKTWEMYAAAESRFEGPCPGAGACAGTPGGAAQWESSPSLARA